LASEQVLLKSKRDLLMEHGDYMARKGNACGSWQGSSVDSCGRSSFERFGSSVQNCVVVGGDIFSSIVNSQPYFGIYLVTH
jgi:hypothetical protein